MASKSGMFLDQDERSELIKTLESNGDLTPGTIGNDTGCLVCGNDDDHNNLMLCEGCNDEYHIYCLDPPLAAVPDDDWYCDKCLDKMHQEKKRKADDGLAGMVEALPREFTSRFGEVCFAYGGIGFGWWPSCIFDPRLTEGSARQSARKNLGKKHIIYFFECLETPFAVLGSSKIIPWHVGLAENYHLGKTARAVGKHRWLQFQQALQAAVIEEGKPLKQRLDWNQPEDQQQQPPLLPLPKKKSKKKKNKKKGAKEDGKKKKKKSGKRDREEQVEEEDVARKKRKKKDIPLYCRVLRRPPPTNTVLGSEWEDGTNVGFVKLPSTKRSTFADARKAILKELVPEALGKDVKWKFHVTTLGPVSTKQEESLGPILPFLRSGVGGNDTSGGSIGDPITIVIVDNRAGKDSTS